MVLALACPVTLPLSRSLSPAPGSDTTSHSSVESVLEQEVARRSSDKHGRIMFTSPHYHLPFIPTHRLALVSF